MSDSASSGIPRLRGSLYGLVRLGTSNLRTNTSCIGISGVLIRRAWRTRVNPKKVIASEAGMDVEMEVRHFLKCGFADRVP